MYSIVLMMALTHAGATPDSSPAQVRYGNHLQHEQYRHRRGCGGSGYGCGGSGYGYGCGGSGYGCGGSGYGCGGSGYGCGGSGYGCGGSGYGCGGYGNGYGYGYGGGGYYAIQPAVTYPVAQGQVAPGEYRSFYAAPATTAMPARMIVHLPANARLTIDGEATAQTGDSREFMTPSLNPGKEYHYTLRAEVPGADGKPQTVTKRIAVSPGQLTETNMDLSNAARSEEKK